MTATIHVKRAYEPAADADGRRVLVDRIWPRGVTKADARLDLWLREIAPSTPLRQWFNHRADRWPEFRRRYLRELRDSPALSELEALADKGDLTLVYGARDEVHNHARLLAEHLQARR